ncbi:MAG: hypothetical protein JJU46_14800, partial [Balneolaceae bacterium]|nr:hypothetical protein [Balneolaceae bacterium]
GIKESFFNTPHWNDKMSDIDAIELALQAEVSSKNDGTSSTAPNLGLGLTFLQLLCAKLNGTFSIISYSGSFSLSAKRTLSFDYPGTICFFRFKRTQAENYPTLFESIKQELGLPKILSI